MRILIVEDEVTLNKTIAEGLQEFGYQTDSSENFKDAEYYIGIRNYDLVLTDWMLQDGDGVDLINIIKHKSPRTSVVVLSAKDDKESEIKALRAGADDYIKKPFDTEELLIRLKKFIKRLPQNKEVIIYENIKLFLSNKTVIYNDEFIDLSKNEFELLYYFIINKGLLLTRMNILDNVWKENLDISDKAVDQCLKRLRKKLPILNDNLISKRGFGYILK